MDANETKNKIISKFNSYEQSTQQPPPKLNSESQRRLGGQREYHQLIKNDNKK